MGVIICDALETLAGYKILQQIGRGSHGEVYRAEREGITYALKVFQEDIPEEVKREGEVLARLSHPNVVRFIRGGTEKGRRFLVTEWVEGVPLVSLAGVLNFSEVLKATFGILQGLGEIHRKGLVHGDLKGSNVLFLDGEVKILDLGLAKPFSNSADTLPAGTLANLAPEILFGKKLSPASDFYSLGILLYQLLVGHYPFSMNSPYEVIHWHLFEPALNPSSICEQVPMAFGDFILRLLAKNPQDRPRSASDAVCWLKAHWNLEGAEQVEAAEAAMEDEAESYEHYGEAIRYYESKSGLNAEESLILAELYHRQGHHERALEALKALQSRRARLLEAKVLARLGQFKKASDCLAELASKEAVLSNEERLSLENTGGILAFYLGDMESAFEKFSAAERLAKASGEKAVVATAYNNLANILVEQGHATEAERYFRHSVELARTSGDRIHEGMYRMSLGYFYHREGRAGEALSSYDESLAILEAVGQKGEWARALFNRANLKLGWGQLAEAEQDLLPAQKIFSRRSLQYLLAYSYLLQGELLRKRGQAAEALEIFAQADRELARLQRPADVQWAKLHQLECLLDLKELKSAVERLKSMFASLPEGSDSRIEGHLWFFQARCRWAMRASSEQVLEAFETAGRKLEQAGELEATVLLHYAWGEFLRQRQRNSEAGPHLAQAHRLLNSLAEKLPAELRADYLKNSPFHSLERIMKAMELLNLPNEEVDSAGEAFEPELKSLQKELLGELDLTKLVEKILDRMIAITRADRGFILLQEAPGPRVMVSRNIDQMKIKQSEDQISWSIATEVLEKGVPLVTVDALSDDRFSVTASIHQLKLRSILCMPFTKNEEVIGCIYLDNRDRRGAFQPSLAQGLKPFAEMVGRVLSNARRFSEVSVDLQKTKRRLEAAETELKIKYDYRNLVGRHPRMLEIFKILDRVTDVEVPVMILGESGAGKELVAKAIHFNGPRASQTFVSLNCQAVPEGLFESELFGHIKGAFTGALADRVGLVEQAHRGTLFLDEIGDMPVSLQGKLLRVLQEGKFRRVGDKEEKPVDCRVLAATHQDPRELMKKEKFREDLFFRLNVVEIQLPPLRERMEDLPLLIDHFLQEYAQRHAGKKKRIGPKAMALLAGYPWPGNVRELENTVTNACVFAEGDTLQPEDFRYKREFSLNSTPEKKAEKTSRALRSNASLRESLEDFEADLVREALERSHGNITQAAITLKVARPQLSRMLKKYRIKK